MSKEDDENRDLAGLATSLSLSESTSRITPYSEVHAPIRDLMAERRVVAALLDGTPWQRLEPLDYRWFTDSKHRTIIRNIIKIADSDLGVDRAHLVTMLRVDGHQGPLDDWLDIIEVCTPFYGIESLREDKDLIQELWRRSQLGRTLQRYAIELSVGAKSSTEVLKLLESVAGDL